MIASVFLSTTVATSAGCYGSFQLTQGLHEWNGQVTDNRFINWLLFLGLVIVPVYEISLLVDGLFFNSIEFWTGDNPAGGGLSIERNTDGTLTATLEGRAVDLKPGPEGAIDLYEDGERVGRALRQDDGSLVLLDSDGEILRHIDAEAVEARRAQMDR